MISRTLTSLNDPQLPSNMKSYEVSMNSCFNDESVSSHGDDLNDSEYALSDTDGAQSSDARRDESSTQVSTDTADMVTVHETPKQKRKRPSSSTSFDTSEMLREFLNRKPPNPVEFLPPKPMPKDSLDQFFDAIASTMRTFDQLTIARMKLQISQIVGKEEIACAERLANIQVVYIEHPSKDSNVPTNTNIDLGGEDQTNG